MEDKWADLASLVLSTVKKKKRKLDTARYNSKISIKRRQALQKQVELKIDVEQALFLLDS